MNVANLIPEVTRQFLKRSGAGIDQGQIEIYRATIRPSCSL